MKDKNGFSKAEGIGADHVVTFFAQLWIRIRMDPFQLAGSGSVSDDPDPDPGKSLFFCYITLNHEI